MKVETRNINYNLWTFILVTNYIKFFLLSWNWQCRFKTEGENSLLITYLWESHQEAAKYQVLEGHSFFHWLPKPSPPSFINTGHCSGVCWGRQLKLFLWPSWESCGFCKRSLLFRYNFKSGEAGHPQKEPFEEIKKLARGMKVWNFVSQLEVYLPNSTD